MAALHPVHLREPALTKLSHRPTSRPPTQVDDAKVEAAVLQRVTQHAEEMRQRAQALFERQPTREQRLAQLKRQPPPEHPFAGR